MTDRDLPPEATNREQDDEDSQAQNVATDALAENQRDPLASRKARNGQGDDDSSQDLVDHMRDMEKSGRIDMGAYRGEPNMDDNPGKYGRGHEAEWEDDDS